MLLFLGTHAPLECCTTYQVAQTIYFNIPFNAPHVHVVYSYMRVPSISKRPFCRMQRSSVYARSSRLPPLLPPHQTMRVMVEVCRRLRARASTLSKPEGVRPKRRSRRLSTGRGTIGARRATADETPGGSKGGVQRKSGGKSARARLMSRFGRVRNCRL